MKKILSVLLILLMIAVPFTALAEAPAETAAPVETPAEVPAETPTEAPAATPEEAPTGEALDKARVMEIADVVQMFLDSQEYTYERNDESDSYTYFTLEFEVSSTFQDVDVEVTVYRDQIVVLGYVNEDIPLDRVDAAANFMMRANWVSFYSHFNMDMDTGAVATYSFIPVEDVLPGEKEIDVVFHSILWSWEDYGDGLYSVAFDGADAKEAFDQINAEPVEPEVTEPEVPETAAP